ncbi:MAG TPA: NDMA-dependent alcohol dehydrogenase [Baekduia sp.]|nr:NDMA-dependent alcohol dehydrogenase [Baekduia sp.]
MKSNAAVLTKKGAPFEILEVDVKEPGEGELLVRYVAAGLCHSDLHLMTGNLTVEYPYIGGHEGAGVVEAVGPGVSRAAVGDHIVCAFIPACGDCRWCATGRQSLCDFGATLMEGCFPDGTYAFSLDGQNAGAMCMLGTFSQYATVRQESVVKIDPDIPLEVAALCSCGVPTGWGAAVNTGDVQQGDTVLIFGIGGVGANAVQGAAHAGATRIIAVDPLPNKREFAKTLGATHAVETAEEGMALAQANPAGGADVAIVTVDTVVEDVVQVATAAIRKNGAVVLTALGDPEALTVHVAGNDLTVNRKHIKGSLFGDCNPTYDIKRMLDLYRAGKLKLDELITTKYSLSEINQGYADLQAGKNIRGVIVHDS